MTRITFIAATRLPESQFWAVSPLGISLKRLAVGRVLSNDDIARIPVRYSWSVAFENHKGLSEIYNQAIKNYSSQINILPLDIAQNDRANPHESQILVFAHDDIWIDDAHIGEHLIAGLNEYDVIGVAGCQSRFANQAAWCYMDQKCSCPIPNASGLICHGDQPLGTITYFGPSGQQCELLDGVLLAVRLRTFIENPKLRFDSLFSFHFYDMDFCRISSLLGLRMGTWPISITHLSSGSYDNDLWQLSYETYLEKWGS